jgi:hypothetical protein
MGPGPNGQSVQGAWRFDAKGGQPLFIPGVSLTSRGGTQAILPQEAWDKHGSEFLNYVPPEMRNMVTGLADYKVDPKTLSSMGGRREQAINWAIQYDPGFDQKTYNERYNAVNRWATGPQGQNLTSVNTSINHLDTLQEAARDLASHDVRIVNAAQNRIATEFGRPGVTSFEGVRDIVADELVKSVIGSAGSQEDRQNMRNTLRSANSPEQLAGMIQYYEKLMAGRVSEMKRNYVETTGASEDSFYRRLSPHAADVMKQYAPGASAGAPAGGGAAATPTGRTRTQRGFSYREMSDGTWQPVQ